MQVTIRPLEEADAATSVKWRNRPEIWAYTASAPDRLIGLDDELAWIRRVIADPGSRRFAIMAENAYVGNIYLTDIADGGATYHIFIGEPAYWGRGVARGASRAILDYARDELQLRTVDLAVHRAHAAAQRLYESLGFVPVGEDGDFIRMRVTLAEA